MKRKPVAKQSAKPAAPAPVVVEQEIRVGPEAVYRALTQAWDWGRWLCREASLPVAPKGKWRAEWDGGFEVSGVFRTLDPGRKVAFTWVDRWSPEGTKVEVRLAPAGEGTAVTLRHGGFAATTAGKRAAAEARKGWPPALENLKSHLEDGVDLRTARRPILGVMFEPLDAEGAAKFRSEPGRVRITGIVPLTGADRGGLHPDDVLLSIEGKEVHDADDLARILGGHKAGDRVAVRYRRDGKALKTVFDLGGRPLMEVPEEPQAVVDRAREACAPVWEEMQQLLAGVTEEEASRPEAAGKWCIREVLAHLSVAERDNHQWMVWDILGEVPRTRENPTVAPERLAAAIAVTPAVPDLFERWKKDVAESHRILLSLRTSARRHRAKYRVLAESVLFFTEHGKMHLAQLKRILAAIRPSA
jgi:uncharacterized protein YndB with AHSA1/START domain